LTRGNVVQKNYLESVPFELIKGLIVVEGSINDHPGKFKFIFDTGAFDSKVEQKLSEELKLKRKAKKKKSDSHGNENEIEMTLIKSFKLGDIVFENTAAGIINYPENSIS